jgi:RNA polymerase sigma-70 factor (ECF subfamily)
MVACVSDPRSAPISHDSTDQSLAEAAQCGCRAAFDTLIRRYEDRAFRVAYRLVGDFHDAAEIVQEAFLRAFRALPTLKDLARFGSWLLRIVTNHALNFRRSRGIRPRPASLDSLDASADHAERAVRAPADFAPECRLLVRELDTLIDAALQRLPVRQRAALLLSSIQQRPQREVAAELGCSIEAVKWHVFQARKSLKLALAEWQ